jgi:hypothetical protein
MRDMADSSSEDNGVVQPVKRPMLRGPAKDPPGRLLGNFRWHLHGAAVVEVLRYKPEGHGINS